MNQRLLIQAGIASALFCVSLGLFIWGLQIIEAQGMKLEEQRTLLAERAAREAGFVELQRVAAASTDERERLQSFFLADESATIDYLNEIEQRAQAEGVTFETKNLSIQSAEGSASQLVVDFTMEGSRAAVVRYLHIIESLPYLSRISNVRLIETAAGRFEAQATVVVFMRSL